VVVAVEQPRVDSRLLLVEYLSWVPRMAMTVALVKATVATTVPVVVEAALAQSARMPQAN
jgi:hypothetical protein